MNPNLGVVVLAAGRSSRMKSGPKLWRLVSGTPLLVHTLNSINAADLTPIVVVVKPHDEPLAKKLAQYLHPPIHTVTNSLYDTGMHSSIQTGIVFLKQNFPPLAGFMICLADQPLIAAADFKRLANAFASANSKAIICPQFMGQRGHPVLFPWLFVDEILQHQGGDRGCFYLLEKNPGLIHTVDMSDDAILIDVDTDDDFVGLTARLQSEARHGYSS